MPQLDAAATIWGGVATHNADPRGALRVRRSDRSRLARRRRGRRLRRAKLTQSRQ
jgi:hypothetical protein